MCRKSYAKIMQIECRTTSSLDCSAEMQLILCKGIYFGINMGNITITYCIFSCHPVCFPESTNLLVNSYLVNWST